MFQAQQVSVKHNDVTRAELLRKVQISALCHTHTPLFQFGWFLLVVVLVVVKLVPVFLRAVRAHVAVGALHQHLKVRHCLKIFQIFL